MFCAKRFHFTLLTAWICGSLSWSHQAYAETITFPDEELAAESVLPVFDKPDSVKNRNINLSRRIEIGILGGMSLLEPFYNPLNFGLTANYHFSEEHSVNITGLSYMQGLSNNAQGLNPIPRTSTNANLQYAPAPKYLLMADYQYNGFYGKMSVTKDFVMNLSLYGMAGLGVLGVGDAVKPTVDLGLGEKLYFSPSFALSVDFRFVVYQGPDVLSRNLSKVTSEQPASTFGEKTNYSSLISLGAVYLFPSM